MKMDYEIWSGYDDNQRIEWFLGADDGEIIEFLVWLVHIFETSQHALKVRDKVIKK